MARALSSEVLKLVPMYEKAKNNGDDDRFRSFYSHFGAFVKSFNVERLFVGV